MPDFTILEPMSIGDIIDRSVRLYRRNFGPLLALAAIPSLIGAFSSTMVFYGYSELLLSTSTGSSFSPGALAMMAIGGVCYPVWGYTMLIAVSAMARVVSDHVMLGEEITFRKCLSAVRRRIGDITIMGLLLFGILIGFYFLVVIVVFVAAIAIVMMAGIVAAIGLPGWLTGVALVVGIIAGAAVAIVCILAIVSRFLFLPQVVMIEGESAGSALGRAIRLGAKNWYRVGAIILFTYFVFASLLAALMLPLGAVLGFGGFFTAESFMHPGWGALYAGIDQITRLLVLPIWMVSFTLLYFDSRVRKEGYDIEVLIHAFQPEAKANDFYWRPVAQPPPIQYGPIPGRPYVQTSPLGLGGYQPAGPAPGRPYVQTSPLGLAGYPSPRPAPPSAGGISPAESQPAETSAAESRFTETSAPGSRFAGTSGAGSPERATTALEPGGSETSSMPSSGGETSIIQSSGGATSALPQAGETSNLRQHPDQCKSCGWDLEPAARFCHRCGQAV